MNKYTTTYILPQGYYFSYTNAANYWAVIMCWALGQTALHNYFYLSLTMLALWGRCCYHHFVDWKNEGSESLTHRGYQTIKLGLNCLEIKSSWLRFVFDPQRLTMVGLAWKVSNAGRDTVADGMSTENTHMSMVQCWADRAWMRPKLCTHRGAEHKEWSILKITERGRMEDSWVLLYKHVVWKWW